MIKKRKTSSIKSKNVDEEFGDEGWMQAVNVRENGGDISPHIKQKLSGAIDKILESVLASETSIQIYNRTLCPELWSEDKKLNPEAKDALLQIAFDFYTDSELGLPIQDVYLLGSSANYNWTPQSDMDVHILIDSANLSMHPENAEKFLRSLVGKWNLEHDITVKGHRVELYLQDVREQNESTGVYSIIHDNWIKEPSPEKISLDKDLIQKKYSMWKQKIEDAIRREDEKTLKRILDILKEYRTIGLKRNGEFSTENIVFKILRATGFLQKIKECYNQIYDKKMTVKN